MLKNYSIYRKACNFIEFIKNKQGAILLPFVMFLPVFIGLLFLFFEISQYLQKKAKLSDAIEQATLALTVENNSNNPNDSQRAKNTALVTYYANAYLPSDVFSIPEIDIITRATHLEYRAATTLSYAPKFLAKNFIPNIDKNISVTDNAIARKNLFVAPTEETDVVFVADYSSSMEEKFRGDLSNKSKIDYLREIFERLNNTILKNSNTNTIGFVPFSWGTKIIIGDKQHSNTYCHFPFASKKNSSIDEQIRAHNATSKPMAINHAPIQKIIESNIDFDETIKSITDRYKEINIDIKDITYNSICLKGSDAYVLKSDYHSKELIDNIIAMKPYGATLVSSGILVGNNIFKKSDNNKLMIILSDGEDTYLEINVSKRLIEKGMCEKVKANDIKMVFIGIGYKPGSIDCKDCVGKGNYFEAHNAHELETDLRQALGVTEAREVGHNMPKD
ncbi:TadE/TadG family type IV pilus assembly protein [Yersinia pekkanenii]|uniref:Tight adherance operon protein n=1 Tax=Yersinia pekkanenii TaxID=1288385 RepID=A0A0T9P6F1_9GAMM|nr:TadE/TadG family type IV pilus assembly protein [Yersinia pekkanenii]CNH46380.1 putative tight adherance operon protein [Yersinia pekkanenii]CRY67615.1 putative tight adherance operon protein [Yersinia pekkanenii]